MPKYLDEPGLTRFYDNIADRPAYAFDTVAEMQAATYLKAGMTCHTNGFHTSGDGGAAYYTVGASGTANGMDVLTLQGGLFAHLVVDDCVSIRQLGAHGDGVSDDTDATQRAFDIMKNGGRVIAPSGTYVNKTAIYIGKNTEFIGQGRPVFTLDSSDISTYAYKYVNDIPYYKAGFWFYDNLTDNEFCKIVGIEYDGKCEQNLSWPSSSSKQNNPTAWSGADYEDHNWFHGISFDSGSSGDFGNSSIPEHIYIADCYIHDTTRDCIVGKPNNLVVENCTFVNSHVDHLAYIQSQIGKTAIVSSCYFEGYSRDSLIQSFGCEFSGCVVRNIKQNPTGYVLTSISNNQDRTGYDGTLSFDGCTFLIDIDELGYDSVQSSYHNVHLHHCYGDLRLSNCTYRFADSVGGFQTSSSKIDLTFTENVKSLGRDLGVDYATDINGCQIVNAPDTVTLALLSNSNSEVDYYRHVSLSNIYVEDASATALPAPAIARVVNGNSANAKIYLEASNVVIKDNNTNPFYVTTVPNASIVGSLMNCMFDYLTEYTNGIKYTNVKRSDGTDCSQGIVYIGEAQVSYNANEHISTATAVTLPSSLASYNVFVQGTGGNYSHTPIFTVSSKTSTGFNLYAYPKDDTFVAAGDRPVHWIVVGNKF